MPFSFSFSLLGCRCCDCNDVIYFYKEQYVHLIQEPIHHHLGIGMC